MPVVGTSPLAAPKTHPKKKKLCQKKINYRKRDISKVERPPDDPPCHAPADTSTMADEDVLTDSFYVGASSESAERHADTLRRTVHLPHSISHTSLSSAAGSTPSLNSILRTSAMKALPLMKALESIVQQKSASSLNILSIPEDEPEEPFGMPLATDSSNSVQTFHSSRSHDLDGAPDPDQTPTMPQPPDFDDTTPRVTRETPAPSHPQQPEPTEAPTLTPLAATTPPAAPAAARSLLLPEPAARLAPSPALRTSMIPAYIPHVQPPSKRSTPSSHAGSAATSTPQNSQASAFESPTTITPYTQASHSPPAKPAKPQSQPQLQPQQRPQRPQLTVAASPAKQAKKFSFKALFKLKAKVRGLSDQAVAREPMRRPDSQKTRLYSSPNLSTYTERPASARVPLQTALRNSSASSFLNVFRKNKSSDNLLVLAAAPPLDAPPQPAAFGIREVSDDDYDVRGSPPSTLEEDYDSFNLTRDPPRRHAAYELTPRRLPQVPQPAPVALPIPAPAAASPATRPASPGSLYGPLAEGSPEASPMASRARPLAASPLIGTPPTLAPPSTLPETLDDGFGSPFEVEYSPKEEKRDQLLGEALFPKLLSAHEVESIVLLERSRSMRSFKLNNKRNSFVNYDGSNENIIQADPSRIASPDLGVSRSASILKNADHHIDAEIAKPDPAPLDAKPDPALDFVEFQDYIDFGSQVSFGSFEAEGLSVQSSPVAIATQHEEAPLASAASEAEPAPLTRAPLTPNLEYIERVPSVRLSPAIPSPGGAEDALPRVRPISMSFRGLNGPSFQGKLAQRDLRNSALHQSFNILFADSSDLGSGIEDFSVDASSVDLSGDDASDGLGDGFGSDDDASLVPPPALVQSAGGAARAAAAPHASPRSLSAFVRPWKRLPAVPAPPPAKTPGVRFLSRIVLYDTYNGDEYDRHPDTATCNQLTPVLAQLIRQELNALKLEMEVHEHSQCYTHYF